MLVKAFIKRGCTIDWSKMISLMNNKMKHHFYAIFNSYHPNTAYINRLLSYLSAWSTMNVEVKVVFVLPDRKFSRLEVSYDSIKVQYLWDQVPIKNYVIQNALFPFYVNKLKNLFNSGDNIYIYSDGYILSKIIKRKDINVYLEKTEHPEVSNPGHWPFKVSVKKYLECCSQLKGLFVISTPLKEYFSSKGVDVEKIHIVNMTVDGSRFEGIIKQDVGKQYIAYCGKATNNKDGVDKLIKAFSMISHKYPNLYLYIIGKAPNIKEPGNNEELANNLGVANKVVFTGVVPHADMPQLLKNATVLALNRPDNIQAKYGFPTKLGEYLLTGNPVVVTAVGDIPLFIENEKNGMLASADNDRDFADKIEWLLDHPEKSVEIGQRGQELAINAFNNIIEASKIINVFYQQFS